MKNEVTGLVFAAFCIGIVNYCVNKFCSYSSTEPQLDNPAEDHNKEDHNKEDHNKEDHNKEDHNKEDHSKEDQGKKNDAFFISKLLVEKVKLQDFNKQLSSLDMCLQSLCSDNQVL